MAQGVLDQRLQQQGRTCDLVQQVAGALDVHAQPFAVAQALQREVVAHEIEFGRDRGGAARAGRERVAQQLAQAADAAERERLVAVAHQGADRVQGIEQEVRFELGAQGERALLLQRQAQVEHVVLRALPGQLALARLAPVMQGEDGGKGAGGREPADQQHLAQQLQEATRATRAGAVEVAAQPGHPGPLHRLEHQDQADKQQEHVARPADQARPAAQRQAQARAQDDQRRRVLGEPGDEEGGIVAVDPDAQVVAVGLQGAQGADGRPQEHGQDDGPGRRRERKTGCLGTMLH